MSDMISTPPPIRVPASSYPRYVTPWNGRGYDFARTFRSKLDYVSPAWYQLRGWSAAQQENGGDASSASPTGVDMIFSLAGGHDFDEAWVSDVRDGVGAGKGEGGGDEDGGVTKVCATL